MRETFITLVENDRFIMEDPDSMVLIMVESIAINPVTTRIVLNGYYFDIDQKELRFVNRRSCRAEFELKLLTVYTGDE